MKSLGKATMHHDDITKGSVVSSNIEVDCLGKRVGIDSSEGHQALACQAALSKFRDDLEGRNFRALLSNGSLKMTSPAEDIQAAKLNFEEGFTQVESAFNEIAAADPGRFKGFDGLKTYESRLLAFESLYK